MQSSKRWIFVYIEFIKIVNVTVFGFYRDRMIRIIKRSLSGLHFLKNDLRFSFGKMFVLLEKRKLLKPEFMRQTSEFDWSKNGNIFDWHRKHIYGIFCLDISRYCLLFILVQSLWNRAWQVAQETWCCFVFTFLLLVWV